ncbi:MAG TPA: hypothetical protein VJ718_04665 [Candidatus Binataceae bacterium]|nr:hypothetical protein [Candidatus Binataceae bacterium]
MAASLRLASGQKRIKGRLRFIIGERGRRPQWIPVIPAAALFRELEALGYGGLTTLKYPAARKPAAKPQLYGI